MAAISPYVRLFFSSLVTVLVLDVVTKWLVWEYIPAPDLGIAISSSENIPLLSLWGVDINLTHAANTGAAWGLFADDPHILFGVRLLLIAGLFVYALCFNTHTSWALPFGLIVGGAVGNVIDAVVYGYVVDMIQVIFWGWEYPIFNIADSAIFIGTLWIFVASLSHKQGVVTL